MIPSSESAHVPSPTERQQAKHALEFFDPVIPDAEPWDVSAEDPDGNPKEIVVPLVVTKIFKDALAKVAAGQVVALTVTDSEVTTQQAAQILKVSRPLVVSLVKGGELAARKVGNRLRLPLADVLAYKAANGPKRRTQPL